MELWLISLFLVVDNAVLELSILAVIFQAFGTTFKLS